MENASKALIIAGAILLSILIIGLGITVYNNASSTTGQANLDGQEVSAHNSKFKAYEGRQKGSNIDTLITTIQSNNAEYDDRQISISISTNTTGYELDNNAKADTIAHSVNGNSKTINEVRKAVKTSTTYQVSFKTADNGLIYGCEIKVYSQAGS